MSENMTFVFGEDGSAYAYLDGKVIAKAADVDELEQKLAGDGDYPPGEYPPTDGHQGPYGQSFEDQEAANSGAPCPTCGSTGTCPHCGANTHPADGGDAADPLPGAAQDTLPGDNLPPRATHVTTPNGIKGQILGKQKGLWGDQVTIRLENGRIAKFDVTGDETYSTEKTASVDKTATLQERLDAEYPHTKYALKVRIGELKKIRHEAASLVADASYGEQQKLHQLIVTADLETHEVVDALAGLEDATPYEAPAPYQTEVVEQESLGGGSGSWLDSTLGEMIEEAEGQDFDQLMNEGPEAFVAELETPALADGGVTRDMADRLVASKVAGIDREAGAEFRTAFLARVEEVRRSELVNRKEAQAKVAKEASTESYDGPEEGLFW